MRKSILLLAARHTRDEKRKTIEAKYLKDLLPRKVLPKDRQASVVRRLFDTVAHDKEVSVGLHKKHNPPRPLAVRSKEDWAQTVSRLSQKQ